MGVTFYIRKGTAAQPYFWNCKASNNEELCRSSENYATKASAQHSVNLVKGGAGGASVVDLT